MKDFYKFLKIIVLVYIIVCLTKKLFSFQENFSENCLSKCSIVNDELLSNPDPTADTVSSDYIINYNVCDDDDQCSVYYIEDTPKCGFITNRVEPTYDETDDILKCDDDIPLPHRRLPSCVHDEHTLVLENPRTDDGLITDFNEDDSANICKKPDIGICRCSGDSNSDTCDPNKCAVQELNLSENDDVNNDNICKGIVDGSDATTPSDLADCGFISNDGSTDSCNNIICSELELGACSFPCKLDEAVTCSDISDQSICSGTDGCSYEQSCSLNTGTDGANLEIFTTADLICQEREDGGNIVNSLFDNNPINCGVCSDADITSKDQCVQGGCSVPDITVVEGCSGTLEWEEGSCSVPTITTVEGCSGDLAWGEGVCSNPLITDETECSGTLQWIEGEGRCDNTTITDAGDCSGSRQWIAASCSNPLITDETECSGTLQWIEGEGRCDNTTITDETDCDGTLQWIDSGNTWTPYIISSPDIERDSCESPANFTSSCSGNIPSECVNIEPDKKINEICDEKNCVPKGSYLDNWNKKRYSTTLSDKISQANKNGYCTLKDHNYLNSLYHDDDNIYDREKKLILEDICKLQNQNQFNDVDARNHDGEFCEGVKNNDNYELEWSDLKEDMKYAIKSVENTENFTIQKSSFGSKPDGTVFSSNETITQDTSFSTEQFIFIKGGDVDPAVTGVTGVTIKYVDRNKDLRKDACVFIPPTDENGNEEVYKCQSGGGNVELQDELNLYYQCSKEDSSSGCVAPGIDFKYSESNPNARKDKCEAIDGCNYNVSNVCFGNTDSSEDVQCPDKYTRKIPSSQNDPNNGYISLSDATDTTEEAKQDLCCEPKTDFCEGNFESSNDIVCPSPLVNKGSDVVINSELEYSGCCESEDEIYKSFFILKIEDVLYNVNNNREDYENKLKNDILNIFKENEFKKLDEEDQITETEFTTEDIEILRIKDGSVIVEYRVGGEDNTERLLDQYNEIIREKIYLPTLGKDTIGSDPTQGPSLEEILNEEEPDDTFDLFGISFKTSYLIMCAIITSILCSVSFGLLFSLSAIK